MGQKSATPIRKPPAERVVRDIHPATRQHYSAEDKIRIVLEWLGGEASIAALCRVGGRAHNKDSCRRPLTHPMGQQIGPLV